MQEEEKASRIISSTDSGTTQGTTRPAPAPETIRIGSIDVGLPPSAGDAIGMMHYITKNRPALWNVARTYYLGGFIPTAIKKLGETDGPDAAIAAVFTILSSGMELGLGFATSLRTIHVVEGRATMSSDLMRGLAINAGCRFEYEGNDAEGCRIMVYRDEKRVGAVEFTIEDARAAGLAGKNVWKSYTKAMLMARTGAMAARLGAPDRLAGLYAPEEVEVEEKVPTREESEAWARRVESDRGVSEKMNRDEEARQAFVSGLSVEVSGERHVTKNILPAVELATDSQRKRVMSLAGYLGLKGTIEVTTNGIAEKRTIVKTDDEINKALDLPLGQNVVVKDLTKANAGTLIEILANRDAANREAFNLAERERDAPVDGGAGEE